jgi:hypothetical protein
MGVHAPASPACCRADVVTSEGGVATAPLQVERYCPDNESDERDENEQWCEHHDLFSKVFSAHAPQQEFEHFDFVQQQ